MGYEDDAQTSDALRACDGAHKNAMMRKSSRHSLFSLCMIICVNSILAAENRQWLTAFAFSRTNRIGRGGAVIHKASIPSDDDDDLSLPEHEVLLPGDVPMDIPPTSVLPLWKLAFAGGVATMLGDSAMHPMDCIKTLQQSDEGLGLSLVQASQYIWSHSGPGGFYRGLATYLFSDGMGGALKFAAYEKLTTWCRENIKEGPVLAIALLTCAAIAFVASSLVLVPGEFIKQQLQMGHYDSLGGAIHGTLAKDGLLGFFAGYDGVLLRDIPYTVLELGLYDFFKGFFHKRPSELKVWQEIAAAAASGGITAFCTTPLDTIKTKLMVDAYDNGFLDCFSTTIQQHGVEAVFAGAAARVVWILPFTALYLPVYELLKRKFLESNGTTPKPQVKI